MPTSQVQNDSVIRLPNLYKYGLSISNFSATSKKLIVSDGMCRDSNNAVDIEVGSELTLDGSVNGANGLDSGTIAVNKMYAIYVIADSRYNLLVAGLISLASNETPTIPKNYDSYRLIGYWSTNGTPNFYYGHYQGTGNDLIFWYGGTYNIILSAGNATSLTDVYLDAFVPPVDNTLAVITAEFIPASSGNYCRIGSPVSLAADFFQYGQVDGIKIVSQLSVNSQISSGVIAIQYMVSNAADGLSAWINGFYCSV